MEIPAPIKEDVERKGGLEGIGSGLPSHEELEKEVAMHKALSDPNRLRILHMISYQELCVCCIKQLVDMSDSRLSYHLNKLKDSGLIEGVQNKNWIIYRVTDKGLEMVGKEEER